MSDWHQTNTVLAERLSTAGFRAEVVAGLEQKIRNKVREDLDGPGVPGQTRVRYVTIELPEGMALTVRYPPHD